MNKEKIMKNIVFATSNKDKVRDIKEMPAGKNVDVYSLKDIGFDEDVEETGTTFTENAVIKAKAVADYILKNKPEYKDTIVLADDSGLEIDYYDKAPGIYSHRWLGERTYPQAMQDVINDMKDVPDEKRTCRFVCSMAAIVLPDEVITSLEIKSNTEITLEYTKIVEPNKDVDKPAKTGCSSSVFGCGILSLLLCSIVIPFARKKENKTANNMTNI